LAFPANMRRRHRNFRCGIWHLNPNLNALLIERRAAPQHLRPARIANRADVGRSGGSLMATYKIADR
jgi:hypothetical protein